MVMLVTIKYHGRILNRAEIWSESLCSSQHSEEIHSSLHISQGISYTDSTVFKI